MSREEVYNEMKETLGLVPTMFKSIPDSEINQEWQLFKTIQLEEHNIPLKELQLMGIGISSALRCRYCAYFHTENARLMGATDEEIEEAVSFAKASAGWSSYLHGVQMDFDQFKNEIDQATEHIKKEHMAEV